MGLREDVGNGPVAFDTNALVYFIEDHPRYCPALDPLFGAVDRGELEGIVSVVSVIEVLVGALRRGDTAVQQRYEEVLLQAAHIEVLDTNLAVAREAARIRATHNLRTPDAIIAATAITSGAGILVTNDPAFRRVADLRVLLVEDYAPAST